MQDRTAMDGVLDLSAKSKHDSEPESNDESSARQASSPSTSQARIDVSSPSSQETTSGQHFRNSIPSNFNPNLMFYQNLPNYSLLANRYLALQHQMLSTLMANQMHPGMQPWMFPGSAQTSHENKQDLSAFYSNLSMAQGGKPRYKSDLPQTQAHTIHQELTMADKYRDEIMSKRRKYSEQFANETKLGNALSDGSTSSFEPNRPRKKFRSHIAETTPDQQTSTNNSVSTNQKPQIESTIKVENAKENVDDCNSSDSKYERNLNSDYSNESRSSLRSEDDSFHSSKDHSEIGEQSRDESYFLKFGHSRKTSEESDIQFDDSNVSEYREKRRKNNAAAKKSRDQKRIQEESIHILAAQKQEEKIRLTTQLLQLRARSAELEKFLEQSKEIPIKSSIRPQS